MIFHFYLASGLFRKKVINLNAAPGVIVRHYLAMMHRGCYKVPWLSKSQAMLKIHFYFSQTRNLHDLAETEKSLQGGLLGIFVLQTEGLRY